MNKQKTFFYDKEKFYIPIHINNFVYCLSSGFVGATVHNKRENDFQNLNKAKISGFLKFPPPFWALNCGEEGPKVVLETNIEKDKLEKKDEYYTYDKLIKITKINKVYFDNIYFIYFIYEIFIC